MSGTDTRPYRVLSLDGGGMRGLYTATLLQTLATRFSGNKSTQGLDIGKGFDLITGTSTGGILACGLARGIPLAHLVALYREIGPKIFHDPMPNSWFKLLKWVFRNINKASSNAIPLAKTLFKFFGDQTLEQLFIDRNIALCIPAVNMATQKSWVFKTPHNSLKTRDNGYKLVDVCLATSAAPIFLPIAAISDPDDPDHIRNFVDGGLWANNPVLIGMIEALEIAPKHQPIEILSIGTCAPPEGQVVSKDAVSWGLLQWRMGAKGLSVALDSQSVGYNFMAEFLAPHLNRPCTIIRLPQSPPSPAQVENLALDNATEKAIDVLSELGKTDGDMAHRLTNDPNSHNGKCLRRIFNEIPSASHEQ